MAVWPPILKGDSDLIEKVQHSAAKLVFSIRNLSYVIGLKEFDITTLVERRLRGNHIDKYDKRNRFEKVKNQLRGHCFKYYKEITRQQLREHFFNRTAKMWNSLQSELVEAPSVNSFKVCFDCWMSRNQSNRL